MFRFTIQAAQHSDVNAVCKIASTVLNSELPPDKLKQLYFEIIENVEQIILLAVNSAHTVGFIHARRVNDLVCGSYTGIVSIAFLPYYQRHGGGTELLYGVEEWSRQMLTPKLKCVLKSDNEAVRQLLKSGGYTESSPQNYEKTIV